MIASHSRRSPIWRLLATTCVMAVMLSGCNQLSSAGQRLKAASVVIAERIGASADDVERSLKTRFSTLSEVGLADEAERSARRTRWMDDALARFATEHAKTARAVQQSTCKVIDAADTLARMSEAEGETEVRSIIRGELQKQSLSEDDQKVIEVAQAILTQLQSLQKNGTVDLQSMSVDLLCLF